MNTRAAALAVLTKSEAAEQYLSIAIDTAIERNGMSAADRGLFTALVYGVTERRLTLDHRIETLAARPTEKLDLQTKTLLRMGLYQLSFMDKIPDHAAVNETVALAPKRTRGFVNAVLRAHLRDGKRMTYPDAEADPIGYLSIRYSFLPAVAERFVHEFGFVRTEELFAAFNRRPPLTLRTNTQKMTREELMTRLTEAGYAPSPTPESPHGIRLSSVPVKSLPAFDAGAFFVQDEASQMCVEAVNAQKGERVLDACACPGSKSFGMALDMQNTGEVVACDLHQNKLSLVTAGAERLGITCIRTQARDARTPNLDWAGAFDRVLCDVPCSGFGVFAKKPELRYKDPKTSEALPDIQLAILQSCADFVRTGGRLVYSTCTLLPDENERNVARFLKTRPDFSLLSERTLTPDQNGTDGFYFAVLEKIR